MAHTRHSSGASYSSMSTLTSISSSRSEDSMISIDFYKQVLEPIRQATAAGTPVSLDVLVDAAKQIINEKFAPKPQSIFEHQGVSLQLDKVMTAMLACADECGGKDGTRYVAGAVVACVKAGEDLEGIVGALRALGITWVTHLLFIFKTTGGHGNQHNDQPSQVATPTLDQTAVYLGEGVILRDGYTCILTRMRDSSYPIAGSFRTLDLAAAHILRRAVGNFDPNHTSKSFQSAVTTFDILRNFTRLSEQTLQELHNHIDHPSNAMMLETNAHNAFDKFKWCLKATEVEHVYDLKVFDATKFFFDPPNNRITFVDHSEKFPVQRADALKRARCSFDLPNPVYLAIHAAIAGVLHMSGAGKFFDELLDKYKDDKARVSAVRCWPDLEALMERQSLTESLTHAFQSQVQVG